MALAWVEMLMAVEIMEMVAIHPMIMGISLCFPSMRIINPCLDHRLLIPLVIGMA